MTPSERIEMQALRDQIAKLKEGGEQHRKHIGSLRTLIGAGRNRIKKLTEERNTLRALLVESDALHQRLNAVEEENDRLRHALNFQKARKPAPLAVPAADCEDCCDTGLGPCMRCANKENRS